MGMSQDSLQVTIRSAGAQTGAVVFTLSCLLTILASPHTCLPQTAGDLMSTQLKQNTVRVQAKQIGFGFIVGEANGQLYIATARHVIMGGRNSSLFGQPNSPSGFLLRSGQELYSKCLMNARGRFGRASVADSYGLSVDQKLLGGVQKNRCARRRFGSLSEECKN